MASTKVVVQNAQDAFTNILQFLQSNGWQTEWNTGSDIVLSAAGFGNNRVFVGLRQQNDPTNDSYYLVIYGMTSVVQSASKLEEHGGLSPAKYMFLDQQPMTLWIRCNNRCFTCVVQISTVYQACYAGLFLPFSTPDVYPYPIFIGGMSGFVNGNVRNWRSQSQFHSMFTDPQVYLSDGSLPSCAFRNPSGQWVDGPTMLPKQTAGSTTVGGDTYNPNQWMGAQDMLKNVAPNFSAGDGSGLDFPLFRQLIADKGSRQTFGALDGVFYIPGLSNTVENTVTPAGGSTHLVVQNAFRTGASDYVAFAQD